MKNFSPHFELAAAVWLIQQPSRSNSSLYIKLPLLSVFFIYVFPHSISPLIPLVLDISGFSFECTDVCVPAKSSSHRGRLFHGDSGFDSTHRLSLSCWLTMTRQLEWRGTLCFLLCTSAPFKCIGLPIKSGKKLLERKCWNRSQSIAVFYSFFSTSTN